MSDNPTSLDDLRVVILEDLKVHGRRWYPNGVPLELHGFLHDHVPEARVYEEGGMIYIGLREVSE